MKYFSTRDSSKDDSKAVNFETVLFSGYASDGGLYVPRDLPALNWKEWKDFNYKQVVAEVLKAFIDDERIAVEDIVNSAYSSQNFDHLDIAPIVKPSGTDNMYILELFHGPTWSFKDYALQIIGQLLQIYLQQSKKHLTLLVVTTGDTGSAAIEAVKKCSNIDIIVLFPHGRITPIQERQMTGVIADNVHVYPGEGVCGDLDKIVQTIFTDTDFVKEHYLGSINSINWARIMIQTAHWFYAYFQIMQPFNRIGEPLTIAVPTGACGNLSGALYAKKAGLPLDIVACNNENDTVHTWIQTGQLRYVPVRDSLASAMDIDFPLNIERIIHLLEYEDVSCAEKAGRTAEDMMKKFYATGESETKQDLADKLKREMKSCVVSDKEIQSTIKRLHNETGYICCPHTATGVQYAYANPGLRPIVCAATAAPDKFDETIKRSGISIEKSEKSKKLENAPTRTSGLLKKGDDWVSIIKQKIISISDKQEGKTNAGVLNLL